MHRRPVAPPLLAAPLLTAAVLLALPATAVQAQSKRDRAAAAGLVARMDAAEARYNAALVQVGNNDPAGIAESNAALEDMEDVIVACGQQRGCSVAGLLPTYKRLLKAQADDAEPLGEGDEDDGTMAEESPGELPTSPGGVPQAASAASLLSADGQRFVRMVQFNPAVQASIRRWLTDMRISLMASYENYAYMQHLMSPSFQQSGLPEALLFGIMAKESNGKVHVGSRAGAVGPLQFMPATGRRFGLGPDGTGFDTRYDPRASADAAARYLNERYAEYGNEIEMWLAAYNGGEGRAKRIHDGRAGRQFWDAEVYGKFPAETRDYVPMVVAAAWIYLHPKEYGITWPKIDARPQSVPLAHAASIYELTICLGNSGNRDGYMRTLRNLNPRVSADQVMAQGTPVAMTAKMAGLYRRWCERGPRLDRARALMASSIDAAIVRTGPLEAIDPETGAVIPVTVATGVPAAAPPKPAAARKPRTHRVARGETLGGIAGKYGCSVGTIARANGLKAPAYAIRPGQSLKLDGCR